MQLLWNNMYNQSELDNYKLQVDLLQQKLKQSEENRQQLQKELQQILQKRSEHDKSVRSKIQQKYQSFLDEQERRNERNKMLMQMLERIDQQSAALNARSERLKMMKLQYERYFAKLMQTQPVRYIQNTRGPTTGIATELAPITTIQTPTQIPVLLPTVGAQQTTTILPPPPTPTAAVEERKNKSMNATQTNPMDDVTANETSAAVLTPRMWTFAMATPTPAGLVLTGTPTTTTLATTAKTYEIMPYPLGYGTILQPEQLPVPGVMRFRNRVAKHEMNDKLAMDMTIDTRDAETSTRNGNLRHELSAFATTSQQTDIKGLDNQPGQQLDLEIEISEKSVVTGVIEPERDIDKIINDISEVHLEDINSFDEPTSYNLSNDNFDRNEYKLRNSFESEHSWEKRGPTGLHSAAEHMRKVAEIDRKFGTTDITDNNEKQNRNKIHEENATYNNFKRFAEIVNPNLKSNDERVMAPVENIIGNQSWNPRISANEYPSKNIASNKAALPKQVSIDNIESAIYGELVNPQLNDLKSPILPTAAQGFFSDLLGQQDAEVLDTYSKENDLKEVEPETTTANLETSFDSTPTHGDTTLGYTNYTTSYEGDSSSETRIEKIENETAISGEDQSQYQATYDTTNTELYEQTTAAENDYGTTEVSNTYAEYPIEQNIDQTNAADNNTNPQLQEQQQQEQQQAEYPQQGYENYDATQYENYDPNAYPGYLYDEATGQYVLDPQYVGTEGNTSDSTYATQEYAEHLPQEQLDYPDSNQTQDNNKLEYHESDYPKMEANTSEVIDATATSAMADVVKSSSTPTTTPEESPATTALPPSVENVPKVLKPTSILATADKYGTQNDVQTKKKKRVNFVDSSETDDSSSIKAMGPTTIAPATGATAGESDFDFSSGTETSVG